jgi:hypothetical protein
MPTLDTIRDTGSWAQGLPIIPKLMISLLILLVCAFTLLLLWTPAQKAVPANSVEVRAAYGRMARVLSELSVAPEGAILLNGSRVDERLLIYYKPFANIEEYIKKNPNNIEGAYETVWDNGGFDGRVAVDDTEKFETLVRVFFAKYSDVIEGRAKGG